MSSIGTTTDWHDIMDSGVYETTYVGEILAMEGVPVDLYLAMGPGQLRDHLDLGWMGKSQ